MSFNNQMIDTSHAEVAVTISEGDGPPVLLIHGNSSCKEIFHQQLRSGPGRHYRMIAMDLPGHGASSNAHVPEKTYCVPGYADTAGEVLRVLGIERAVVLGWSLGGHIGIDMADRNDSVAALMISGAPPIGKSAEEMGKGFLPSEHMGLAGQEHLSDAEANAYLHAVSGTGLPIGEFQLAALRRTDGRARSMLFEAFKNGVGDCQREIVERMTIPLAIVNGRAETVVNNDYLNEVRYANLWGDSIHLLDGIGHAPFWEAPERFNSILERFLADVSTSAFADKLTAR